MQGKRKLENKLTKSNMLRSRQCIGAASCKLYEHSLWQYIKYRRLLKPIMTSTPGKLYSDSHRYKLPTSSKNHRYLGGDNDSSVAKMCHSLYKNLPAYSLID
jgi:hypothetical protein